MWAEVRVLSNPAMTQTTPAVALLDPQSTPKVCLNMIVKNESRIIERCLQAALPLIDACVIADTGSSDNTKALIETFCARHGLACEIHEFAFENFEQARNQALRRCLASPLDFQYLLFIDADNELCLKRDPIDIKRALWADAYQAMVHCGQMQYAIPRLIKRNVPMRYVGVTHEYLDVQGEIRQNHDIWVFDHTDGGAKTDKFERDIGLLTQALQHQPDNSRYWFYLATSYYNTKQYPQALAAFDRRVALGGWPEEVFYSLLQIAQAKAALQAPPQEVSFAFLAAYQFRPTRAEPLVELARFHRLRGEHALALLYARQARRLLLPSDILFVNTAAYGWQPLDEIGASAFYVGALAEGRAALETLLADERLPTSERPRVEANLAFY
jgi:glycosyltransferase involved in cell wall biosynthesis